MFGWFDRNQRWLKKGLKLAKDKEIREYFMNGLPSVKQKVQDAHFFVLDFETTGLDVTKDHIISAGFTEIKNNRILLNTSEHHLVSTKIKLTSENVGIHHLTDDVVAQGMPIKDMLNYLLEKMTGKVLIAHYQKIEYTFIQYACQSIYGLNLPMIILDTMAIEKKLIEKLNRPLVANQLRLFNLRDKYNLPRYNAHNAMEDAISTAELFLAQVQCRKSSQKKLLVKDFL